MGIAMNTRIRGYLEQLNDIDHNEAAFRDLVDEITMREYRVLAMVQQSPMILKEVASHRSIAAQGIGRLVERLRKRNLLKVERNPDDKREKLVSLTPSGYAMVSRCHAAMKRVLRQAS